MGIILTSCLLLVSKPKDQVVTVTEFPQDGVKVSKVTPTSEFERNQITISVMHELDSLDNIYRVRLIVPGSDWRDTRDYPAI